MQQVRFNLTPQMIEFLCNYKHYGFNNKNAMIQTALIRLKEKLELENLRQSADLYAEVYEEDSEMHELTGLYTEKFGGIAYDKCE